MSGLLQHVKWAKEKGLFAEIYETVEEMDTKIQFLVEKLACSNPESIRGLKEIMWEGTEHWDQLLMERAEISGKRVLSDFTRKTIEKLQ